MEKTRERLLHKVFVHYPGNNQKQINHRSSEQRVTVWSRKSDGDRLLRDALMCYQGTASAGRKGEAEGPGGERYHFPGA